MYAWHGRHHVGHITALKDSGRVEINSPTRKMGEGGAPAEAGAEALLFRSEKRGPGGPLFHLTLKR